MVPECAHVNMSNHDTVISINVLGKINLQLFIFSISPTLIRFVSSKFWGEPYLQWLIDTQSMRASSVHTLSLTFEEMFIRTLPNDEVRWPSHDMSWHGWVSGGLTHDTWLMKITIEHIPVIFLTFRYRRCRSHDFEQAPYSDIHKDIQILVWGNFQAKIKNDDIQLIYMCFIDYTESIEQIFHSSVYAGLS